MSSAAGRVGGMPRYFPRFWQGWGFQTDRTLLERDLEVPINNDQMSIVFGPIMPC